MSDFSISVIIPTFNRAQTLRRALDSVLKQDYPIHEIIVIDDGSSDNTTQIIEENYPAICLIRQENRGVSAARNRGIHAASGQWIALLDSDDCWSPSKLSHQIKAFKANPKELICHTNETWMDGGKRRNPMKKHAKKGGALFVDCLSQCTISPSTVMIKKALFEEVGYFDPTLPVCEDYDLWLRICARYEVLYIDQALSTKYGGHEDQLSRQYWGMDRFRIQAIDKLLKTVELEDAKRAAALRILKKKCEVLVIGAVKHQNKIMQNYGESVMRFHGF